MKDYTQLPSISADVSAQKLADYYEGDLLKVYVYERVEIKNKYVTLKPNTLTYVQIIPSTRSINREDINVAKSGDVINYFEVLAEVTAGGELQPVDKTKTQQTKFINMMTWTCITNDFSFYTNDTPKLYTIGEPFDEARYLTGDQAVYFAEIGKTSRYDVDTMADIITPDRVLQNTELVELVFTNSIQLEKQVNGAKLIYVAFSPDYKNPRVNIARGALIIPWADFIKPYKEATLALYPNDKRYDPTEPYNYSDTAAHIISRPATEDGVDYFGVSEMSARSTFFSLTPNDFIGSGGLIHYAGSEHVDEIFGVTAVELTTNYTKYRPLFDGFNMAKIDTKKMWLQIRNFFVRGFIPVALDFDELANKYPAMSKGVVSLKQHPVTHVLTTEPSEFYYNLEDGKFTRPFTWDDDYGDRTTGEMPLLSIIGDYSAISQSIKNTPITSLPQSSDHTTWYSGTTVISPTGTDAQKVFPSYSSTSSIQALSVAWSRYCWYKLGGLITTAVAATPTPVGGLLELHIIDKSLIDAWNVIVTAPLISDIIYTYYASINKPIPKSGVFLDPILDKILQGVNGDYKTNYTAFELLENPSMPILLETPINIVPLEGSVTFGRPDNRITAYYSFTRDAIVASSELVGERPDLKSSMLTGMYYPIYKKAASLTTLTPIEQFTAITAHLFYPRHPDNLNQFYKDLPLAKKPLINVPGFTVGITPQTLISTVNATGVENIDPTVSYDTGDLLDLSLESVNNLIPLKVTVIDDQDRVELDMSWFDPNLVPPMWLMKSFIAGHGALWELLALTPDDLTKTPLSDDIKNDTLLLYDLILITFLYQSKFRNVPTVLNTDTVSDKIKLGTLFGHRAGFEMTALSIQSATATAINTGLVNEWQTNNKLKDTDLRTIRMKGAIAMLSKYIACDYAINGGANAFVAAALPYYIELTINPAINVDNADPNKPRITLIAADSNNLHKYTAAFASAYIQNAGTSITGISHNNLSQTHVIQANARHILPKLPSSLSKQPLVTLGGGIKSDDVNSLSYVVYLPVNSIEALKRMYLYDSDYTISPTPNTPQVTRRFQFDLPNNFMKQLSDEELDKLILSYMKSTYGIRIKTSDISSRGAFEPVIATSRYTNVVNHDNVASNFPQEFYKAYGVEGRSEFQYNVIYPKNHMSAGFPLAGQIYRTDTNNINGGEGGLGFHDRDMFLIMKTCQPSFIGPEYSWEGGTVVYTDPITGEKVASGPTTFQFTFNQLIHCFYGWQERAAWQTNYRYWELDFEITKTVYRYNRIIVDVVIDSSTLNEVNRPRSFNKNTWFRFLNMLNRDNLLYSRNIVPISVYTEEQIDYLSEVDIRGIWYDRITLFINGKQLSVPSLNADNNLVTYQKIILP